MKAPSIQKPVTGNDTGGRSSSERPQRDEERRVVLPGRQRRVCGWRAALEIQERVEVETREGTLGPAIEFSRPRRDARPERVLHVVREKAAPEEEDALLAQGSERSAQREELSGIEPRHRHLQHGDTGVGVHGHERNISPVIEAAARVVGDRDVPAPQEFADARRELGRAGCRRTACGSSARGSRKNRRRAGPAALPRASSAAAPSGPTPSRYSWVSASPGPSARAPPSRERRREATGRRAPRR